MIIFPAIDLYDGCAVRLLRGDYDNMTVYSRDPAAVARGFREAGAEWLHVVDLGGARDGGTPNFDILSALAKESGLRVQAGGGVRTEEVVERYLNAGAERVILGTAAVMNPGFARDMAARYGGGIAVGVDIKDGHAAIRGWAEVTELDAIELCLKMRDLGVKMIICTDISKDGALAGANMELYRALSALLDIHIIASGGVTSVEDVAALRDLGLHGAILGKALYTGAISLRKAIEAGTGA